VVTMRLYLGVCAGCVLAVGCGGDNAEPTGAGGGGETLDPCEEAAGLESVVVGDFEQANALGFASTAGDLVSSTPPVPPVPPSDVPGLPTTQFDTPRCGTSRSGIHVVLRDVADGGYSVQVNNMGTAVPNPAGLTYFDARDFTGLSFWVRVGPDSNSTFFASIKERYTVPSTGMLFPEDEKEVLLDRAGPPPPPPAIPPDPLAPADRINYCEYTPFDVDGNGTDDPTLTQCDSFGKGIGLGQEWRFFKVPFDLMRQRAYGRASQQAVADRRILGLEFRIENGPNWDFWLDDVAFYREP
jgi:hypothetical protein